VTPLSPPSTDFCGRSTATCWEATLPSPVWLRPCPTTRWSTRLIPPVTASLSSTTTSRTGSYRATSPPTRRYPHLPNHPVAFKAHQTQFRQVNLKFKLLTPTLPVLAPTPSSMAMQLPPLRLQLQPAHQMLLPTHSKQL
jgi:hypothetical protein